MSTSADWGDFAQLRLVADDLDILATSRAGGPVFETFVREYEAHYPDDGHKETPAGWTELLGLRQSVRGQALRAQFGNFVEVVAIARQRGVNDDEPGELVGGFNFSMFQFTHAQQVWNTGSGNYLFSRAQWQGHGYGVRYMALVMALGKQIFAGAGSKKPLPIIDLATTEIADPLGTASDRALQLANGPMKAHHRAGARMLDFQYGPPNLSVQDATAHPLSLMLFDGGETVDPCLLKQHLERFFVIAYQKGEDIVQDSPGRRMLDQLEQLCQQGGTVPTISPRQWLDERLAQQR